MNIIESYEENGLLKTRINTIPQEKLDAKIYINLSATINKGSIKKYNISIGIYINDFLKDHFYVILRKKLFAHLYKCAIGELEKDLDVRLNILKQNDPLRSTEVSLGQGLTLSLGNFEFIKIYIEYTKLINAKDSFNELESIENWLQEKIRKEKDSFDILFKSNFKDYFFNNKIIEL